MTSNKVWRSIDDFSDADLSWLLARAEEHLEQTAAPLIGHPIVGLCFLETSLRTRFGFAAATARLGGQPIAVIEQRHSEISMAESIHDTIRTMLGYCDIVVTRLNAPLAGRNIPDDLPAPILSGGDRGPHGEHPTQAILDLFALRRECGDLTGCTVAICGDPAMRSVASLLRLLQRVGVASIPLITAPELAWRWHGHSMTEGLVRLSDWDTLPPDTAALYMAGVPHQAVSLPARNRLMLTSEVLERLPAELIVTSPLPVIDEITSDAWKDPRVRAFQHSDWGLYVRMALLELVVLGGSDAASPGQRVL